MCSVPSPSLCQQQCQKCLAGGGAEHTGTNARRHGPAIGQSHGRARDQAEGPQSVHARAGNRGVGEAVGVGNQTSARVKVV